MSTNVTMNSVILAMAASGKKHRRSSCHSSCCFSSWPLTSLVIAASLLRRLITALSSAPRGATFRRSSGLVLQILRQCSCGKCRNASSSSRATFRLLSYLINSISPGRHVLSNQDCIGP